MNKLFLLIGSWGVLGDPITGTIAVFDSRTLAEQFQDEFTKATHIARGMSWAIPTNCVMSDADAELEHTIMIASEFRSSTIEERDFEEAYLEDQKLNPTMDEKFPRLKSLLQ